MKLTIVIVSEGPESSCKHTRMSDHKEDEMDESILDNDDEKLPTFASKQTTSHLGPDAGSSSDTSTQGSASASALQVAKQCQ